jgi:hypothetical protein
VGFSEVPKSAELKNKEKNEMMFEKIKNIYKVPSSSLALRSIKTTSEYRRNSIIKTFNIDTNK